MVYQIAMYTAKWCKACKTLMPHLEVAQKRGVHVDFIDVEIRPDLAELENINALPTMLFSINGTRTRSVTGASTEAVAAIKAFGVSN